MGAVGVGMLGCECVVCGGGMYDAARVHLHMSACKHSVYSVNVCDYPDWTAP